MRLHLCTQGNLDETAAVEGSVIDCLLAMVMKLSEVTFRPLFFKVTMVGWAGSAGWGREPCTQWISRTSAPTVSSWDVGVVGYSRPLFIQ